MDLSGTSRGIDNVAIEMGFLGVVGNKIEFMGSEAEVGGTE